MLANYHPECRIHLFAVLNKLNAKDLIMSQTVTGSGHCTMFFLPGLKWSHICKLWGPDLFTC